MRSFPLAVLFAVIALGADALAQGGRGRGRAEEIMNRVGAWFADTNGPVPADGGAVDLATAELVRAAVGAGHPSVLYLVNGADDQDVRDGFERQLFADDELGISLRCFPCGRIDLAKEATLAAKYGKQAPLFVVFDRDGKAGDVVSMNGYKPAGKALQAQLAKATQGVVKPSLAAFAKDYGDLVRDLEQVLAKKKNASERLAKAGGDKAKRAEVEKDLAVVEREEQKLLEQEREFLAKNSMPARPDNARRLGATRPGQGQGQGGDRRGGGEGRRGP